MRLSRTSSLPAVVSWLAIGLLATVAVAQEEPPPLAIGDASASGRGSHLLPPASAAGQKSAHSTRGPSGWWMSLGGGALVLAIFGGLSLASRRLLPSQPTAPLRVVGRASLSPKHAVYLVRAGDRVLILGAGAQGPPALLGEWTEPSASALPAGSGNGAGS